MAAFKLIAPDGTEYGELANGTNLTDWMGLSRALEPKGSRQGVVLFDAPRAVYNLQVADEFYDGETGSAALIDIPIRLPGSEPEITKPIQDRKSVVQGKSVSVRVDLGGSSIIKNKKTIKEQT